VVIEGDLTVIHLRARRCGAPATGRRGWRVAEDGRHLVIRVGHASIERVHHVDIAESPTEIVVTAWVGTLAHVDSWTTVADTKRRAWSGQAQLSAPVGRRKVRDGALAPPAAGPPGTHLRPGDQPE